MRAQSYSVWVLPGELCVVDMFTNLIWFPVGECICTGEQWSTECSGKEC